MGKSKRNYFKKQSKQFAEKKGYEVEEVQLRSIMKKDPEMAELYQETFAK